jgi:hypothetical protein
VRRHRQVTADDAERAEALFGWLRDQGVLWAEAERIVAEELCVDISTWRRWRARLRHNDRAWFGPRAHTKRLPRRSWITNSDPPLGPAELLTALERLLR